MVNGRRYEQWNHTSSVVAAIVNVVRSFGKKKLASPSEFHPLMSKKTKSNSIPIENIGVLEPMVKRMIQEQRKGDHHEH